MCHTEFSVIYKGIYLQTILNYLIVTTLCNIFTMTSKISPEGSLVHTCLAYIICKDTFICIDMII